MPISYNNGDLGIDIRNKINGIFGIERGALADPWELTFDIFNSIRTLSVDEDIELTLALSGKVSWTYETIITTGDLSHQLTFPADWVMLGDDFDNSQVQEISFKYTGTEVIGIITTIGDIPDIVAPTLTSSTMNGATTQTLDLVFSESVTISTTGWSVSASGGAVTISSVANSGTSLPKFTLSRSIGTSETLTISYDSTTGSTTDISGNELVTISGASVINNAYTIDLEVLFTGTTVDTSKGTITNPDASNLTFSQNGTLRILRTTDTGVASTLGNYYRTVNTYTRGAFAALLNKVTGFTNSIFVFIYYVDANNDIAITSSTTDGLATCRVRVSGSTVYTLATAVPITNRWRIRYGSDNIVHFEYYSLSVWVEIDPTTTKTYNVGAAGYISCNANSVASDAPNDLFTVDEIYVTSKAYTTAVPS